MHTQTINQRLPVAAPNTGTIHRRTRNPFRIIWAVWRTIRDPADTESATILEDVFMRSRWLQRYAGWEYVAKHLGKNDGELMDMPRPPHIEPTVLAEECAEGTLGFVLGQHFLSRGLNPNIFADQAVNDGCDAIRVHIIGTHDIWHVVTGFDNDIPGEFGVVAFTCAQTHAPIATLLLAVALLNTALFEHEKLQERLDAMVRGWQMGKAATPLFGIDWTTLWQSDLAELRERLLLPQVSESQGIRRVEESIHANTE